MLLIVVRSAFFCLGTKIIGLWPIDGGLVMHYTEQIDIDVPRSVVAKLWGDPNNLAKWQMGLISYEPVFGVPGQEGAQANLQFKIAGREITMLETVIKRELPEHFYESFQAADVFNALDSHFSEIDATHTRWVLHTEYRCRGYMQLLSWVFPKPFRQDTRRYQRAFKQFAERQYQQTA